MFSRNNKWYLLFKSFIYLNGYYYLRERQKVFETFYIKWKFVMNVNPLTPMSDQDRIFPYNINTISTR